MIEIDLNVLKIMIVSDIILLFNVNMKIDFWNMTVCIGILFLFVEEIMDKLMFENIVEYFLDKCKKYMFEVEVKVN